MITNFSPTGRKAVLPPGLDRIIINGHTFTRADFENWPVASSSLAAADVESPSPRATVISAPNAAQLPEEATR